MLGDDICLEESDGKIAIDKDLNNIHILTASEDVLILQRLLNYASTFAERSILHQPPMTLFGTVNKEPLLSGVFFVNGK